MNERGLDAAVRVVSPPVTIQETETEVVLEAEMAGIPKDQMNVTLEGDELHLRGTRREDEAPKGYAPLLKERRSCEYRRSFVLGPEIDKSRIEATCRDGIVKVVIRKTEKVQPKKIQIQ
jgi:HSP20 family protein